MNSPPWFIQLAPELILLVGACLTLLVGLRSRSSRRAWESAIALLTVLASLAATFYVGVSADSQPSLGLWLTPLTHYARWITLSIGALVLLVNWHQPVAEERGEYMAMILFSLLGVLLTASANDLIILFFALELVSIPTYILVALSRQDQRASEASVKYFFLGALAAAILAYGLTFMYGAAGTTAMHVIKDGAVASTVPSGHPVNLQALIGFLLVLGGLAFKIAAVPFHVYAPDVYEGAASPVTGMLGFVPKFAGFVALIKVFAAWQWDLPHEVMWLLWALAAATLIAGNVLALLQNNVKRMLAYSSIAHTGYMLIGLLVGPVAGQGPLRDGVAALLFYIAVYGAMNLGAFALLSALRTGEREVETLDELAGVAVRSPFAGLAFAICVFSLMGFPPTAGFLGKLYIFSSAFSVGAAHPFHGPLIALAIIGVVTSVIGAAYYLRIVSTAYMGRETEPTVEFGGFPVRLGLSLCSLAMLLVFAWPAGVVDEARRASAAAYDIVKQSYPRIVTVSDNPAESLAGNGLQSGSGPRP